jgi:hypothetical protein
MIHVTVASCHEQSGSEMHQPNTIGSGLQEEADEEERPGSGAARMA